MPYVFSAVFGLLLGSLAGAAVYRLPRGQTLLRPARSHCVSCGKSLTAADLVPLFSFLLLRGKCRFCGQKLSWRYPATELLTAGLFCAAYWRFDISYETLAVWGLCFCLVCLSLIDYDFGILPDGLNIAAGIFGVGYVAVRVFAENSLSPGCDGLLGAAVGALPLLSIDLFVRFFAKKDAFGLGDVKLMAACGLFLSASGAALALFFAVMSGGLCGAVLLSTRRLSRGSHIPFGPFLAAGVLVSLWFGQDILSWYLGMFVY